MIYPINWADEDERRRLFVYQTRIGIAHKFGTLPIGWYQCHQCHAYDVVMARMKEKGIERARVRCVAGVLYAYPAEGGRRVRIARSVRGVYLEADRRCRA